MFLKLNTNEGPTIINSDYIVFIKPHSSNGSLLTLGVFSTQYNVIVDTPFEKLCNKLISNIVSTNLNVSNSMQNDKIVIPTEQIKTMGVNI